jgi:putative CRISPR-associated protein (TIGR02619 family)
MKSTVICSVGVSLYGNLEHRLSIPYKARSAEDVSKDIKTHTNSNKASAEITSIYSLINNGALDMKKNLYLLLSDTDSTKFIGDVLKHFFSDVFENVHLITIKGLTATDPDIFKEEGLRELVKSTSQIIYNTRQKNEECVINATGGFKAQISFLEMVGQIFKLDVYYQFEDFKNVIKLPQLPISLDFHIWIQHYPYFDKLSRFGSLPEHQLLEVREELSDFIEEAKGQVRLSSIGLLVHQVLLERFSLEGKIYLPKPTENKGEVEISGYGFDIPLSLQTLLDNISRLDYVNAIKVIEFKADFAGRNIFKVNQGVIIGLYSDGRHTWKFDIETTSVDDFEKHAICVDLNLRYSNPFEKPKPAPVEFVIIRHGHHIGEYEGRIEGWADFPLSEIGLEQARVVAQRVKKEFKVNALYSSSLKRAQQTASIIGDEIEISPVVLDDLKAMNYGDVGGLKKEEANIRYPLPRDRSYLHNKAWGSESEIEFNRRILESFYQIYYSHPGETVVIITHGTAIGAIFKEMLHLPMSHEFYVNAKDTSIHHFTFGPDQTIVHDLNNAEHLVEKVVDSNGL